MGRYYALADGEQAAVAEAIREHYLPRGAGDALPDTRAGDAVALADKIDVLAGIFAIGQKPTGTRDPFALRRAAIGVLRIVLEHRLDLDLLALLERAVALQPLADLSARAGQVVGRDLRFHTRAAARTVSGAQRGQRHQHRNVRCRARDPATLAAGLRCAAECTGRLSWRGRKAPVWRRPTSASPTYCASPRTRHRRPSTPGYCASTRNANCSCARIAARPGRCGASQGQYANALELLAGLRAAVDEFFDHVLVNDPDIALRNNRLALLAQLRALFAGIADLSRLPG